ncbi:hypothetical protein [Flavobacterium ginsenosidimutans]|uniref:hypothetical protein n=1 Tax=Flavobacterium ginsenosidimutans TaxID=687844 RepID=UPI0013A633EE|nr:hypothetical protein [Flavobacterium ginsenosidimutans]KAF2330960.1 hypothetical protein DM444_11805 [Flavobacterium ginsenosidimutans]
MHPQQRKALIEILAGKKNRMKRNFLKKDSEKLAGFENAFYICTPQNRENSLTDWEEKRKNGTKKKFQIFLGFSCRRQKEFLVLHPL